MTSSEPTVSARRIGSTTSKTRTALLDHAQQMMLEGGYPSISYRTLAARAGVASSLVQYYFPHLDELFLALLRRNTDELLGQLEKFIEIDQPLRAVWKQASSETGAILLLEFMALANNRKAIQREIGHGTERLRAAQLDAVTAAWARYKIDREDLTPAALLFMMNAIPRMMRLEKAFGSHTGHADTAQIIERFLDQIEPLAPPAGGPPQYPIG